MYTLDKLQVLNDLVDLAATAPTSTTGIASSFWDDLVARIKAAVKAIIDDIVGTAGTTLSGIQSSVKSKIQTVYDDLVRFIGGIRSTITDKIGTAKGSISDWITTTETNIKNKIDSIKISIGTTINGVISVILGKIGAAKGSISDWIATTEANIKSKVDSGIGTLSKTINTVESNIKGKIDDVMGGVGDAIKTAVGWIKDKLDDVIQAVKDIGKNIGDAISGALKSVGDWIGKAISDVIEGASSWITTAIQNITETIGGIIQDFKNTIGGVIDSVKQSLMIVYQSVKESIEGVIQSLKETFRLVKETVEQKIQAVIDWLKETAAKISQFFWDTMTKMGEWIATHFLPAWATAVDWAQKVTGLDPSVLEDIKKGDFSSLAEGVGNIFEWAGNAAIDSPLFALALAIAKFWNTVALQFVPAQVAAQKQAIINLALEPISLDQAASALFRGKATEKDYYANASLAGVTKDRARMGLEASKALPTPGAIQMGFLRGEISVNEHDRLLSSYGYSEKDIDLFKALYFLIPSPNDLIRMAVKEAFTPDIAQKFGQYEDYPVAFTEWALKQGISKEWAERYWAAHWELPSPQMGFEMLHRGVIGDDELKLLLRALDVMPYWRERLIQISYNPLTRVDVRRMYKLGVINEEQVYKAYTDLGYDEQRATWLTEFTTRYYTPEDETEQDQFRAIAKTTYSQAFKKRIIGEEEYRQFLLNMGYYKDDVELLINIDKFAITQSDKLFDLSDYRKDWLKLMLNAYDRGLVSWRETMDMLLELGYDETEANLEINILDYNRQLKLRNILLEQIHDQYVNWIIDIARMNEILLVFNFRSQEIDKLQEEWDLERNFRTKRPSLSDLKKFLDQGLLSMAEFLDELRGIGYNEKYIGLYQSYMAAAG